MPIKKIYHSFDAWGAQAMHRARTEEEAVTQHLLHWGLMEAARIHVQAHEETTLWCPDMIMGLDPKTRPEKCTGDHTREIDDEIGEWRAENHD